MAAISIARRPVTRAVAVAFVFGVALSVAGCATNNANLASYFGGAPPKPKSIVVSDFEVVPGTISVDHGLAPGYRRKLGKATPDQLKTELATAIDEAFTQAMVTTLTDGGLPVSVGGADSANTGEQTIVISGRVRKLDDKDRMRRRLSGLSPPRGSMTAEVQVNQDLGGARKELLTFVGDGDVAGKPATAPSTTPSTTTASTGTPEKLTSSAAAEARRAGRASANRILAFAAEQGWLTRSQ